MAPKNWKKVEDQKEEGIRGQKVVWNNTVTGTEVVAKKVKGFYGYGSESWEIGIPAWPPEWSYQKIGTASARKPAIEVAEEWMRNNPRPEAYNVNEAQSSGGLI